VLDLLPFYPRGWGLEAAASNLCFVPHPNNLTSTFLVYSCHFTICILHTSCPPAQNCSLSFPKFPRPSAVSRHRFPGLYYAIWFMFIAFFSFLASFCLVLRILFIIKRTDSTSLQEHVKLHASCRIWYRNWYLSIFVAVLATKVEFNFDASVHDP